MSDNGLHVAYDLAHVGISGPSPAPPHPRLVPPRPDLILEGAADALVSAQRHEALSALIRPVRLPIAAC